MEKGTYTIPHPKTKRTRQDIKKVNKNPIEKTKDTQKEQYNSNIILKPTATWQQVQQAHQRTSL